MLIGTAGHIDHGKTTLVKALTGVDADRLPEEKARGITLDLGYAYAPLADGTVLGFVDVPGHEKLIHNMLAGATGIDFVLLVIAADDGPMPQTREHLELLDLLGLNQCVVALTKIDTVAHGRLVAAQAEVGALLAGSRFAGSPVFPVSGNTGEGIAALREHLEQAATACHARFAGGRFRLAIDRCFSLAGTGTVVTGTAHAGKVGVGETAIISPAGQGKHLQARVRGLHVQGRPADTGQAGERIALALAGDFGKQDITRGMWVVDPALAQPITRFHGELRVPAGHASHVSPRPLAGEGPGERDCRGDSSGDGEIPLSPALSLKGEGVLSHAVTGLPITGICLTTMANGHPQTMELPRHACSTLTHLQRVHVHLGSDDIPGRVALLDGEKVGAGGTALVEILLDRETLALRGDRFILRDAGAQRTVAGGRVLDIFPPLRHKRAPQHLALLDALRDDDPFVALALLAQQSTTGVDLARFALNWNLADGAAATSALWQRAGLHLIAASATRLGFAPAAWDALATKLLDALSHEHARAPDMIGVERERLRRMCAASLPRPAFDALANALLTAGKLARTRAWLHLPGHQASLSSADDALFQTLKPLLDAAPFKPPRVRDVGQAAGLPEEAVRQLFKRLARAGLLFPVAHDHYFTAQAVADLAAIVRQLNDTQGAACAARFRDAIYCGGGGGGRKVAIQILEFFDRIGYTRRVRDTHRLRRDGPSFDWATDQHRIADLGPPTVDETQVVEVGK